MQVDKTPTLGSPSSTPPPPPPPSRESVKSKERDEEKASSLRSSRVRDDERRRAGGVPQSAALEFAQFAAVGFPAHVSWQNIPYRTMRVAQNGRRNTMVLADGGTTRETRYKVLLELISGHETLMCAVQNVDDRQNAGLVWLHFTCPAVKYSMEQALVAGLERDCVIYGSSLRLSDVRKLKAQSMADFCEWHIEADEKQQQQQPQQQRDDYTWHTPCRDVRFVEQELKQREETNRAAPTRQEV